MSYQIPGTGLPAAQLCRYGVSRLQVRGPRRDLDRPYFAFLGGAETFGRFVETPFPALVEEALDLPCVNLGCINAGLDAFLHDVEIMRIARAARAVVIQLPAAHTLSNRFYRVHPRRNDRFVAASSMLKTLYPEVDFTDFHFVRHMLGSLRRCSDRRFAVVQLELEQAWIARMRLTLRTLDCPTVALWLQYRDSSDGALPGEEPLFVTSDMVRALRPQAEHVLHVTVSRSAEAGEIGDMIGGALNAPAAAHLPGPSAHRQVAAKLTEVLRPFA